MEYDTRIKRLISASLGLAIYLVCYFLIHCYLQESLAQRSEFKAVVASLGARVHEAMSASETALLIETLTQLGQGGEQPLLGLRFSAPALNTYLGEDKYDIQATIALLEQAHFESARAKLELLASKVDIAQSRDVRIRRYLSYLGLAGALALAAYTVLLGVNIRRTWSKESTVAWTENPPLPGQPSFESYLNNVVHEEAAFSGHRASLSYSGMRTSELPPLLSDIVRQLIEQLVRNSVEHGGRPPEQRVMAGKSDYLNISVSVDQSDSAYYVSVEDDGEGLDAQQIVRRAADLGLITIQQANALPAKQATRIIFLPEFHDSNRPAAQAENDQSLYELRMLVSNVGGVFSIQNQVGHHCRFIVSFPKDKLPSDSQN